MSELWGNLEQVEVTMFSASACAFLRSCTLGILEKGGYLSCCTQPSWQLSESHQRLKNQGEEELKWESIFCWGKFCLAHSPGVRWCPGICMQQCLSPWLTSPSALFLSLQSTFCKLQTQFWRRIAFLCQDPVASRQIKAVGEIKLSPSSMAD